MYYRIYARKDKDIEKKQLTPVVKEILDQQEDILIKNTSDEAKIYWVDVKKTYPEIAEKLKFIFDNKNYITIRDLKLKLVEEQDQLFWLSEDSYDYRYGQARLKDIYEKHQEVLQLNLGHELINKIKKDNLLTDFFTNFSRIMEKSLHPVHTQTIGWIRYYKFPKFWVIEEIQSDLFGEDTRIRNFANSKVKDIIENYSDEEKKKVEEFLSENFKDWDKKLVATLMNMARKEKAEDIWIFDEDIKEADTNVSPSKLKHFYRRIPREMGFKRDKLKIDKRDLGAWHRILARNKVSTRYTYACLLTTLRDIIP